MGKLRTRWLSQGPGNIKRGQNWQYNEKEGLWEERKDWETFHIKEKTVKRRGDKNSIVCHFCNLTTLEQRRYRTMLY
jgi:hypothetical protein